MSTVKPRAHRTCILRNVCLDTSSGNFTYFRDRSATQAPVLFDRRYGHIFAFGHVAPKGGREDLLPLNKHVRYKRHVRWSPTIIDGPMPAVATSSSSSSSTTSSSSSSAPLLSKLHLLSAPFVPTNLGHLAWEEAFPLLLSMVQLGEYVEPSEAVVLRTHACNESVLGRSESERTAAVADAEAPTRSEARLCTKFVDGFMAPIGSVRTMASLRREYFARGSRRVCFRRLIAGGFFEMFNAPSHPGKEPWLQLYRRQVLRFHRLAPPRGGLPPPPSAHKALLVRKHGRRGIHNFDEVLTFLQSGCGGLCEGLGRTNVVAAAFETMTIREQLQLVSTSTLAVSPPGGCSMILPFLPEGAHAILINYMLEPSQDTRKLRGAEGVCSKCSLTMEASLWRHVRHVRKLQYQVWEPSDFARGRPGRDQAVVIKLPRLAYLVRVALDAMAAPQEK